MVQVADAAVKVYRPQGRIADLFRLLPSLEAGDRRVRELMIDGPAGTGKSFGWLHFIDLVCRKWPGTKVLIVRQTRVSLTDSAMATYEDFVLHPDDPVTHYLLNGASRAHRQAYTYPNGSMIVLGCLEKPTKLYSTEWNIVCVNEATEVKTADPWQRFHRALRYERGCPFHLLLGDCNPDSQFHWIWQRWMKRDERGRPQMHRLQTTHQDNPRYWNAKKKAWEPAGEDYVLGNLRDGLDGHTRDRLYKGLWVSAPGAIYGNFDLNTHVLHGRCVSLGDGRGLIETSSGNIILEWFMASQDFGMSPTHPGVQQIWGFDAQHRMYLVEETYRTGKDHDWWADNAERTYKRWLWRLLVCDLDLNAIKVFNDRLGSYKDREVPPIARAVKKGPNSVSMGIAEVHSRLMPREDGWPCLFLMADSLSHEPELGLVNAGRPSRTVEEFGSYVWEERAKGDPDAGFKDVPKKDKDDGMDACRYAVVEAWRLKYTPKPPEQLPAEPGTWKHLLTQGGTVKRAGFYG